MARGRTARSQAHRQRQNDANDALRKYGYPSMRELRREAQGLAGASVPSVREVRRPYTRQIQSSKEYLAAVRAALAETQGQVGSDYSQAVDQSQGVADAAQARLAALGLGVDQAGTQAAVGARGDSATQNLIANQASAGNYAAQLPAIASGQATQFADVTRNKMLDALSSRRDSLSQAFFQALQQVQSQALAKAQFNQSSDQFSQQMAQSQAQFNAQMALSQQQFAYQKRSDARSAQLQADSLMAQYGYDVKTGKFTSTGKLASETGLTPTQISAMKGDAQTRALAAMTSGQSWSSTLQALVTGGINPKIAQIVVAGTYGNPPPLPDAPAKMIWDSSQGKNVTNPDYLSWKSTAAKIKRVRNQYLNQMDAARWRKFISDLQSGKLPKGMKVKGPQRGTAGWTGVPDPTPGYVDPATRDPFFYGP